MGAGNLDDLSNLDSATLLQYLPGVRFPAEKEQIASTAEGNSVGASTAVMSYAIGEGRRAGARYFDFGVSNEQEGWRLNEGLYRFKASFGAGGVAQEFYEVTLENSEGATGSSREREWS